MCQDRKVLCLFIKKAAVLTVSVFGSKQVRYICLVEMWGEATKQSHSSDSRNPPGASKAWAPLCLWPRNRFLKPTFLDFTVCKQRRHRVNGHWHYVSNGVISSIHGYGGAICSFISGYISYLSDPLESLNALLDFVHTDVCGKRYFQTIIDGFSKYCMLYLLKSEVPEKVIEFIEAAKIDRMPKVVLSDQRWDQGTTPVALSTRRLQDTIHGCLTICRSQDLGYRILGFQAWVHIPNQKRFHPIVQKMILVGYF